MIIDAFDVIADNKYTTIEDAVINMRCKACSHEFDAEFDILRPVNVKHDLGQSVTVVCPNCLVSGQVKKEEAELQELRVVLKMLDERLEGRDLDLKFRTI